MTTKAKVWLAIVVFVFAAYAVSWVANGGRSDKATSKEIQICQLQKDVHGTSFSECVRRYGSDGK